MQGLSVLHFNENGSCEQATTLGGERRNAVSYPKGCHQRFQRL